MKKRIGFVSNSSSSSFIINLNEIKENKREEIKNIILNNTKPATVIELNNQYDNYNINNLYNLVEYKEGDNEMHIWVRRDESMCNDELDDILYEYQSSGIAKFDKHF